MRFKGLMEATWVTGGNLQQILKNKETYLLVIVEMRRARCITEFFHAFAL